MRAQVRKFKRRVTNEPSLGYAAKEAGVESLKQVFDEASLRNISLEERRREASKPLYLIRYE